MAETTHLEMTLLDIGQAQKEVTINEALNTIDISLHGPDDIDVSGGSQVDLTVSQLNTGFINLSGALSADIDVTIPDGIGRRIAFRNGTTGGFTITLRTFSGAVGSPSNDLTPGAIGVLVSDLTEAYLALGGGGGGGAFTDSVADDNIFPTVAASRALLLGPSGTTANKLDVRDDGRVTASEGVVKIEQDDDTVFGLHIINSTFSATDGLEIGISDTGDISMDAIGTASLALTTAGAGGITLTSGTGPITFGPMSGANLTALIGTDLFSLESGDAGALGPVLRFKHDSASPAAADIISTIRSVGKDSTAADTIYSEIRTVIEVETDTAEDAKIEFFVMDAGTLTKVFGIADPKITALVDTFEITLVDAGATGPLIDIFHDSASPADDDDLAIFRFQGNDSGATKTVYAEMRIAAADVTDTEEDGRFEFLAVTAGALTELVNIAPALAAVGQNLNVAGAIKIGTTAVDGIAGSIRWTGSDFEGNTGSGWISMAGGGAGSAGGTGVDNQVAVWSGTSTIEGDAAFTFDTTNDQLDIGNIRIIGVQQNSAPTSDSATIYESGSAGSFPFDAEGRLVLQGDTSGTARGIFLLAGTTPEVSAYVADTAVFTAFESGTARRAMDVIRQDNGSTGAILRLDHDTTAGVDGDEVAFIQFRGRDSTGVAQEYARITGIAEVATFNVERGRLQISCGETGSLLATDNIMSFYAEGISDGVTCRLHRGDMEIAAGVFELLSDISTTAGNDEIYDFKLNRAGNGVFGPRMQFLMDATSVAVGDELGRIQFAGNASGTTLQTIAEIEGQFGSTTTNGTEDGRLILRIKLDGTKIDALALRDDGAMWGMAQNWSRTTITAAGTTQMDDEFTVWDCDATLGNQTLEPRTVVTSNDVIGRFYVVKKIDSSSNTVTINPAVTETIDGNSTIVLSNQYDYIAFYGGADSTEYRIYSTNVGTMSSTGSPVDNQVAVFTNSSTIEGNANFVYDSSVQEITLFGLKLHTEDLTATTGSTAFCEIARAGGGATYPYNGLVGQLILKARTSADRDIVFVCGADVVQGYFDGDADAFVVGRTDGTSSGAKMDIYTTNATEELLLLERDENGALGPILRFYHNSDSPAAADTLARFEFDGESSTSVLREYARIEVDIVDPTNASENAEIIFSTMFDGTLTEQLIVSDVGSKFKSAVHKKLETINATTTLDQTHYTVLCDASGGGFTVNLPTAASAFDTDVGRIYVIKAIDVTGGNVTIDGDGTETIDGVTTIVLSSVDDSIMIQSDGSNWVILADHVGTAF